MRQITVTLGLHFDFSEGMYVIDYELGQPLTDEILRQYPSIASVRDLRLLPTANKVLQFKNIGRIKHDTRRQPYKYTCFLWLQMG